MGIYISGVKGLPEQVQENKENIKDIQEEISGIDWDAIHNLENQVAENTQDINNMEGTIGTQNIAITQLGGRVDDLEDKTQDITRQGSMLYIDTGNVCLNADLTFEDSGASIKLNNEDNGANQILCAQDSNNFIDFDSSNNLHIMSDGGEYEFRDDTIYVNSSPIGNKLYRHHFRWGNFILNIDCSASNLDTPTKLANWLYNKGITTGGNDSPYTVEYQILGSSEVYYYLGVYSSDGTTVNFNRYGGAVQTVSSFVQYSVIEL